MSEENNNNNKDIFEMMLASHDNNNNEQFPVLRAFQSYLDAEREKARKRQSQITICFLVSTIVLVVCFCVVGFAFFSKFIEKDDQLTQLLLLERAGVNVVPQQPVVQPVQQPIVVNTQANELSDLIAELKKEREALEALKADIVKKQTQAQPPQVPVAQPTVAPEKKENTAPTTAPEEVSPKAVDKSDAAPVEPKEKAAPVAKDQPVKEATKKPTVNKLKPRSEVISTTTTTTTSTTTTTTVPQVEKTVEVELPRNRSSQSVPPKGYVSESMKVVTENNVYVPWHILLPDAK